MSCLALGGRSCLVLALTAGVGTCEADNPISRAVQVQIDDSAGVRVVVYEGTPAAEPALRFSTEPRYRHGANPGDYAFQGVSVGRFLPDGSAVVYDEWNAELVALGRYGKTYDVIAMEGEGPGEVGHVNAVLTLGHDSILVADPHLGRVTLFVDGSAARTTALRYRGLEVVGIGSSRKLILATSSRRSGFDEEWLSGHLARFDTETGALDTVASYDFIPHLPPGLEWDPIGAVGDIVVSTRHVIYTRSDRAEVTWYLPDGTVSQILRWQAEPALLTEERLQPIEAEHRADVRMHSPGLSDAGIEEITQANMAAYRASIGRPVPLFGSPIVDSEGRIWLAPYPDGMGEEPSHYNVISSDGEWLGTVEVPPRFRILDVAAVSVLGVELDEMDVEAVAVYELSRLGDAEQR